MQSTVTVHMVFNLAIYIIESRKMSTITYSVDKSFSRLILSQTSILWY